MRSVTDITVTIDNDGVAISVTLDRRSKVSQVPHNAESITRLTNTASQSELGTQGNMDRNTSSLPNQNGLKPA